MFKDFKVVKDRPVYIQLKDYLKKMIMKGHLLGDQKIPSTRELSELLSVSRNTVLTAYADLEQEGLIYAVKGKGNFVAKVDINNTSSVEIDWKNKLNTVTTLADELDLMKHGVRWEKGMIVFNSIAPDEKLFDVENFKRAFLTRMSIEGDIVLNYGYAKGYKPLMNYLTSLHGNERCRYFEQRYFNYKWIYRRIGYCIIFFIEKIRACYL